MPELPTLQAWRTRTSVKIGARGKTNHELLEIDQQLALYSKLGKWRQSVEPAIEILNIVAKWERRRRGQQSTRRAAMFQIWSEARAVIVHSAVIVCQSEFHTLRQAGEERFLYTGGATCCVVVVFYDETSKKGTMGHIQESNPADASIKSMAESFGQGANVKVWLAGGRAQYQKKKIEALVNALEKYGVNVSKIDSSRAPQQDNAPTLNVAFDRQTGDLVDDASEIKMLDWKLRSMYPQVGKTPPLVPYMEPMAVLDDVGFGDDWKRKAVPI